MDGRRYASELVTRAERRDDGTIALYAPRPGLWRSAPARGALVRAGDPLGELEVLGVRHRLRAPEGAHGVVTQLPAGRRLGRRPVDAHTLLCVLDPSAASAGDAATAASAASAGPSGPAFHTPLGGRYYARPSPAAEPFVRVGDEIRAGTTVALIEVMKTFNRVTYGGAGVPARARVKAILVADGDDVEAGDVLLELEALE
ncbi:MAG: biotin/lipoyl-binding protein [Sandaracinaceae bacterium]|nr:biotin/lipoyl-binding protein [Sandaracinaceae bacterium]